MSRWKRFLSGLLTVPMLGAALLSSSVVFAEEETETEAMTEASESVSDGFLPRRAASRTKCEIRLVTVKVLNSYEYFMPISGIVFAMEMTQRRQSEKKGTA